MALNRTGYRRRVLSSVGGHFSHSLQVRHVEIGLDEDSAFEAIPIDRLAHLEGRAAGMRYKVRKTGVVGPVIALQCFEPLDGGVRLVGDRVVYRDGVHIAGGL